MHLHVDAKNQIREETKMELGIFMSLVRWCIKPGSICEAKAGRVKVEMAPHGLRPISLVAWQDDRGLLLQRLRHAHASST